jgi:hypothetical protein
VRRRQPAEDSSSSSDEEEGNRPGENDDGDDNENIDDDDDDEHASDNEQADDKSADYSENGDSMSQENDDFEHDARRAGPSEAEKQGLESMKRDAEKDLSTRLKELEKWEREGQQVSLTTLAKTFMEGVMHLVNKPSESSVSKIDTWGTEKTKGQSLQDWLQHVNTVLDARNVSDEERKVKIAATYLRGHAANRWKQCLTALNEQNEPITWRAFKNALQTQHDGVLPAQKAREHLMDFRVSKHEKPRSMTIRFRSLMDEVRLQEQHSRVNLPDGETLLNAYMNALKRWEHVHEYAVRLHAEKLGKWDEEAQQSKTTFDRTDTQEKWLQILQAIMDAVRLWDNGSNMLGGDVREPEVVKRAKAVVSQHQKGTKRPMPHGMQPNQFENKPFKPRKVRKIEDIFALSPEVYKERKDAKVCFACGEKHFVHECAKASKEQKQDYAVASKYARKVADAKRNEKKT